MKTMSKCQSYSGFLTWFMALMLGALVAGCGGGGGGDPILGGGGSSTGPAGPAPTVNVVTPIPNATGVPINTKIITATFTNAMDPASLASAFTLACPAGTPVAGAVVSGTGSVATLTLAANLPANTICTATISTGAKDTAGVPLANNLVWTFTTAAAADITPPTVTGTINANGATNVAINTKVGATFSEVMDPATISATTFTLKQGATAVAGAVTYAGVNAVFTPASNLAANTVYTVTITTGAKDVRGNALASNFVWSWTTGAAPDTTAPTVTATAPVSLRTNIGINTQASVTFSEAMDPLTITNLNVRLQETVSSAAVAGTLSYTGVTATYIPLSNLKPNTNYTVTVVAGTGGVKDLAGNPMANTFQVGWTTGAAPDTTAPTVTATAPVSLRTNVGINTQASVTFSEAMNPLTITNLNVKLQETVSSAAVAGTLSYTGVTATYIPLSALKPNTNYTVTVVGGAGGVKDLAGNPLANTFQVGWTTGAAPDTTAPAVTATAPVSLQTNVAINTQAGVTFSEAMDPLTITNLNVRLQETVSSAAVAGTLGYTGVTATYIPLSALKPNTNYTVTVVGGAGGVKDLAGNPLANTFQIGWTTAAAGDTTAPTVTFTSPVDLETGVAVNKAPYVLFSESMDPLTISTSSFTITGPGGAPVAGTVGNASPLNSSIFSTLIGLAPNTTYTGTITTAAKDLAGNALAANKVWTFTTGGTTPPPGPSCALNPPLPVNLGLAGDYVALAKSGITTTGVTKITGDIGVSPIDSTAITGFGLALDSSGTFATSPLVTGKVYASDYTNPTPSNLTTAINNLRTAYVDAAGRPTPDATDLGAGNITGRTITAGLYKWGTGVSIDPAGAVTLSGCATDVWIFQIAGDLLLNSGAQITLAGAAQAKNVYWQVGGGTGVTLETTSAFQGIILATKAITFKNGATLNGRALAETAVTLIGNTVTAP